MKKLSKHKKVRKKSFGFLEEINKVLTDYAQALHAVNAPVKQHVSVEKR